jgi:hypothetical protein
VTCVADIGRSALTEAEAAAFGGTDLEADREIDDLARRAAAVTTGSWWRAAGAPDVTVTAARASARSSRARDDRGAVAVALAAGQQDVATLAHELAHALAGVAHGHDDRFRAALVDVTVVLAGPTAAAHLADALSRFDLAVAPRAWPPPARAEGDGFVLLGA